ncbi:glutamate receptor U1-like isoform X2 [Crassostrea virginica]
MLQNCCWLSVLCILFPLTTQDNFTLDCDNEQIGIFYTDIGTTMLVGHQNKCEVYRVDFSELYSIIQKVQEIIRDNLDYVFIPSDTPAFIQDYIKKFINMTQVGVTGDWIAYTNNSEIPSTDGPHHFVTRKGSLAHLDLVFTIFKDLKWHFSVIFFDNTYAPFADVFTRRINKEFHMHTLYNADDFVDESDLFILFKEMYTELAEYHINVTIFCSQDNARKILSQNSIGSIINIYTLMWKTSKKCSPRCTLYRIFEIIGCVKSDGSVNSFSEFFPNWNFGFNRRHLLVTTIWWPPFTERIIENGTTVDYFGYCMELLKDMGKSLNFTYTVTEARDGEFGRRLDNGSWTGMIGQLERREVDLMVATTSIRPDREMVMDFTIPFFYDSSSILMKKPDPNEKKVFILARPLHWEVMACTAVVLIVCALFLCLVEKLSPYYKVHGKRGKQDFQHSFWYMFGALLTQGGESVPKSSSGRTLISAFWLFSIVLVGTYSGNLIAFLTVPLNKPPFNSLEEMIAQTDYKWGTIGGTFFVTWFNTSTTETLQAVWSGIKRFNETDPEVLSPDPNVHISKMYREKYVYIGDKVYMDLRKSNQCDLMTAEEEIPNNYYAVGLPNNSLYTKTFSDQVISLQEGGILYTFKEKHWPKSVVCFGTSGLQSRRISLIDLQSAFYLIGGGLFIGVLVLLLEFIYRWFETKCGLKKNNENCVHLRTITTY